MAAGAAPGPRIDIEIERLALEGLGPDAAAGTARAVALEVERLLAGHGLAAGHPEALRVGLAAALEQGPRR